MANKSMYKVLNTKIAAIHGKMLAKEDYRTLLNMKSIREIVTYLKNHTEYARFLPATKIETIDRTALEKYLDSKLVHLIDSFRKYTVGPYREFVHCFYMKYEIAELKQIASYLYQNEEFPQQLRFVFLEKNKKIDLEKISSVKSVKELIENLIGTIYYSFLKNLLKLEQITLFHFEMTLDKAFFNMLAEKAGQLSKRDRDCFYKIYGSYFDMLNIQMIYRGKKYYNRSPEELFNYSIMEGNNFNYKKIKEFCYCRDLTELKQMVNLTPYNFMLKGDKLQDIYMERRMHRYMYYRLKRQIKGYKDDISSLLAILMLVDFEKNDLITIIESVGYGLAVEKANQYLIQAV